MSTETGPRRPAVKSQLCHRHCGWPWEGNFRPDLSTAGRTCELNEAAGGYLVDEGSTAASCHPGTKSSPWQSAWLPGDKATGLPSLMPPSSLPPPRDLPSALRRVQELKLHLAKEVTQAIQCFLRYPSLHTWAKAMVHLTFWDICFKNCQPLQVQTSCYKSYNVALESACQVWSCSEKLKCAHLF